MRRFPSSPRHRPIARDPVIPGAEDDLSTWSNTANIATVALPGTSSNVYHLVVDATRVISAGALADTNGLRFVHSNGVRLAHKRTPGNRILLIGNFHGGLNTIHYYWGKIGATQPGNGFPSAAEALVDYRLGLIFDNSVPLDITPNPAPFTVVGSPTYETYSLGQSMRFADGSYIQTDATKLRGDARNERAIFASVTLPSAAQESRIVCLANWNTGQRGFQLWMKVEGLELYISDNGTSFQRWLLLGGQVAGPNAIGASWKANDLNALLLCNDLSTTVSSDWEIAAGPIFNTVEPYIVGGSPVPGAIFTGTVRAIFERDDEFKSVDHFNVWRMAWEENDAFWGLADREPDSIDVPDVSGAPLSSEVAFARIPVTGITSGTSVAVNGPGNPSYSIGSSFSSIADIKAKGSTSGNISPNNWLATYHESAAQNLTVQETSVTVGTVTSPRRSTTVAATGGGTYTPGAPANYFVNTVSGLISTFATAKGGEIIEIAPGDYTAQGQLLLQNRDLRGGQPLEIRSATLPWRGYTSAEGGLVVPDETKFTAGSGGSEFSSIYLRNVHNVIITGLRTYQGNVGTGGSRIYSIDCISCNNLTLQYMKLCGFKPTTAKKLWGVDIYRPTSGWYNQGRGIQLGVSGSCSNITMKKSLIHYFGEIGFYNAGASNTLIEDVVFSDQMADHLRSDGQNSNLTVRRSIFYRAWGRRDASGAITHNDHTQNTTKTQSGWRDHTYEYCIFSPGDCAYPHIQGIFYECDNYPQYVRGTGLYITNCFFDSRAPNTVYSRPGDKVIITKCTILQNQFGGLNELNEAGTDSLLDTIFNNPNISVASSTTSGHSLGNNVLDRTVFFYHDFSTNPSDQILNCTQLLKASYAAQLEDFQPYNGPIRAAGAPALPLMGSSFKPLRLLNSSYVLDAVELRRAAPKLTSTIHPNQKGMQYGCSELFQSLGALPLS